jgi:glycosyltransferase involved in cell wall biosynthesis
MTQGGIHASPPPGSLEVAHVLWRLSRSGGVQTVVRRLVDGLDPARVHLTVVSARPSLAEDGLADLPITVDALGHAGSVLRPWDRARLVIGVSRALRKRRPDVVQFHSGTLWLGLLAPIVNRRPGYLVEVHDAPGSGRHSRLTDRFEGVMCRLLRATLVCHSRSVALGIERHWHLRGDRVCVVPLAVDLERFRRVDDAEVRAAGRARLGLHDDAVVFVAVGRLVPSKRVDRAIEAVAALTAAGGNEGAEVQLLVVGDGPERESLMALAATRGMADRVVFTGALDADALAVAVGIGDVAVSTSDYEGFGLTSAEAMAAGLPVVATAVGGVPDVVVDGETGVLVPVDDAVALAGALSRLASDTAARAAFGAAGQARAAAHFSTAAFVEAFGTLYAQVARRRKRR